MPITLKRRVAREVIRVLLIRCRLAATRGQSEAAKALGIGQSSYAAYESDGPDQRMPDEDKLVKLLRYFGFEDRAPVMLLILEIARSSSRKVERDVGLKSDTDIYILLEYFAESITVFEMTAINGLLQIPEYGRALLEYTKATTAPSLDVDEALALRMDRKVAFDRPNPLAFTMYVHEFALRREVGGRLVLIAQLEYLLKKIADGVIVRVVPMDIADLPATRQTALMQFTGPWCVAYSETTFRGYFHDESHEIQHIGLVMGLLHKTAYDAAASTALIHEIIRELKAKK